MTKLQLAIVLVTAAHVAVTGLLVATHFSPKAMHTVQAFLGNNLLGM